MCPVGQMAASLCPDAGPVVDWAFGLPADRTESLRSCSWDAAQQDKVGVRQTHQSGARGGGPHQEGGSDFQMQFYATKRFLIIIGIITTFTYPEVKKFHWD